MNKLPSPKPTSRDIREILGGLVFALALFGYPIVANFVALGQVESRSLTVPYRLAVAAVCLGIVLTYIKNITMNKWRWLLIGAWAVLFARLVEDYLTLRTPVTSYALPYFISAVLLPCAALLVLNVYRQDLFAWFGVGFAGFGCAMLLIGHGTGVFREFDISTSGRMSILVLNPISAGHLGLGGFLCCLCLLKKASGSRLAFLIISSVLCLTVLFMANSKAPILGLLLIAGFWVKHKFGTGKVFPFLIACTILSLLAFQTNQFLRISRLVEDSSTQERIRLIKNSLQQISEQPWLGSSLFERETFFYVHNIFLEVLMSFGVVLGLVFLVLIGRGIFLAWRSLGGNKDLLGLLFFQGMVIGVTSGSLFAMETFWVSLILLFVAAGNLDDKRSRK